MIHQIQQDTKNAGLSMNQGTTQVGQGVELANKTGEALSKIHSMVSATAEMIQQIASAAEEHGHPTNCQGFRIHDSNNTRDNYRDLSIGQGLS